MRFLSSDSTNVLSSAVEYAKNLQFGSRLVGKHRQLTPVTKKRSSDLLQTTKGRAIIPHNRIIHFVASKRSSIDLHASRKADRIEHRSIRLPRHRMKNRTEQSVLLSCGVFCFRRHASYGTSAPFLLTPGRDFLFPEKISEFRNNSLFSPCSTYGKEKSKFFHSEGLKTRESFCIW